MYTAKQKDLNDYYQRWLNSTENTIYKAYGRPSRYKLQAWERCQDIMHEFDGYRLRIVGHNGHRLLRDHQGKHLQDAAVGGEVTHTVDPL